jgi:hypothetical protein
MLSSYGESRVSRRIAWLRMTPGEQIEIVLDHAGMNRLRGHIGKVGPWLSKEEEEKEKTLFVSLYLEPAHRHFERNRGHDHDRLLVVVEALDRTPEWDQLLLQRIELCRASSAETPEGKPIRLGSRVIKSLERERYCRADGWGGEQNLRLFRLDLPGLVARMPHL